MIMQHCTASHLAIGRGTVAALAVISVLVVRLDAQSLRPSQRFQIDVLAADFVHPPSPGCAVGVSRRGTPLFARRYGSALLEHVFTGIFYGDDVATAW